jgi:hypothetical protein
MPKVQERRSERPYYNWSIYYTRRKHDLEALKRILLSEEELSLSAQCVLDQLLQPLKGKRLPLCQTVLVEDNYFDHDYVASNTSFYSKGFIEMEKFCRRLHFFSCRVTPSDVTGFGTLRKLQDSYLGFCVIRPIPTKNIGRTFIKPRREDPRFEFHTCCARCSANIAGETLSVDAVPFMEQDSRVQTCSSVAMWISTTIMGYCFDSRKYTTSEIMEKATQTLIGHRAGPTQGLTYEQIMQALFEMGYEPIIFDEADRFEAIYDIYSYVESGIPPILLIATHDGEYHALTAVGHTHTRPLQGGRRIAITKLGTPILEYYRSSEWVSSFYIQDDQRGIYRELTFLDADPSQLRQRIEDAHRNTIFPVDIKVDLAHWHCPLCIDTKTTLADVPKEMIANLWGVIVPLPSGVTLSHSEAELKAAQIIKRCADERSIRLPRSLTLRSYLIPSNDYKSRLGNSDDMNDFVRQLYRSKQMPKWLWIVEMSTKRLMDYVRTDKLRIRGELILDATSNPWPTDFVAFHWIDESNTGIIMTMIGDDADIDVALRTWWHGPDAPYRPMVR